MKRKRSDDDKVRRQDGATGSHSDSDSATDEQGPSRRRRTESPGPMSGNPDRRNARNDAARNTSHDDSDGSDQVRVGVTPQPICHQR
jgi:hypothetical protein